MNVLERLEALERKTEQMYVRGTIDAVDCDAQRVRVRYGPDSVTDWIEWKPVRSGLVTIWSPPQVGEGCSIHSDGDLNRGEAYPGSYHASMPTPSTNPDETVIVWPDGTKLVYDMKQHKLNLTVAGDVAVGVSGSASVSVEKDLSATVGGKASVSAQGDLSASAGGVLKLHGGGGVKVSGPSFAFNKG